jgi:hypothetical protein
MVSTTFEEERREVWASILETARQSHDDPDRAAACIHLLRHIIDTAVPRSRQFRYHGRQPRRPMVSAPTPTAARFGPGSYRHVFQ